MSLNTELFMIAKNQVNNDFFGRKEVKETFLHKRIPVKITVVVDEKGNFVKVVDSSQTVYTPASYDSLCRNNGDHSAYSLHDQLRYVSNLHLGETKNIENVYHTRYMEALSEWYEYTKNPRLKAILEYCSRGTILNDLKKRNLKPTDNIAFAFPGKQGGIEPVEDEALFDSFIQMQIEKMSRLDPKGWCYITGQHFEQARIFPRGLYGFNWRSHYLSRQDTGKTVYFGIFEQSTDAAAISKFASYYIFWALNFILEFYSLWIKNKAYALVSIDGKWMPDLGGGVRRFLGMDGEITKEDFEKKEKEVLSAIDTSPGILYLSVGAMTDAKITIRKYQSFAGKDKNWIVRNCFSFMETMCCFKRRINNEGVSVIVSKYYEGLLVLTKKILSVEKIKNSTGQFETVIDDLLDSMILGVPLSSGLLNWTENMVMGLHDRKTQTDAFCTFSSFLQFNNPEIKGVSCYMGRLIYLLDRIAKFEFYKDIVLLLVEDYFSGKTLDDVSPQNLGRFEKEYKDLIVLNRIDQGDKVRNILGYRYEMEKNWRNNEKFLL